MGLIQGLLWLWPLPLGTHSQTSRSVERWPSCSITPSEQAYRADEAAARQQQAIPLADGEDYGDEFSDEEVPF